MISLKAKAGIPQDFKSSENSFITFITDSLERLGNSKFGLHCIYINVSF